MNRRSFFKLGAAAVAAPMVAKLPLPAPVRPPITLPSVATTLTHANGGRMVITGKLISVFDETGALRARIGEW